MNTTENVSTVEQVRSCAMMHNMISRTFVDLQLMEESVLMNPILSDKQVEHLVDVIKEHRLRLRDLRVSLYLV